MGGGGRGTKQHVHEEEDFQQKEEEEKKGRYNGSKAMSSTLHRCKDFINRSLEQKAKEKQIPRQSELVVLSVYFFFF